MPCVRETRVLCLKPGLHKVTTQQDLPSQPDTCRTPASGALWRGQTIETSLFETAVWTQASDYATTAVDEAPVRRRARHQMLTPTANRYPCGDGNWVVFNMPGEKDWARFCKALGLEHWIEDERYATGKSRYQHMQALTEGVDEALSKRVEMSGDQSLTQRD